MKSEENSLLTINSGASSIKFAMYQIEENLTPILSGSIENINAQNTTFSFINAITEESKNNSVEINDFEEAANYLLDWLECQVVFRTIKAVGHRLANGMQKAKAEIISIELLNELKQIRSYELQNLPCEIKLIELFIKRHPIFVQVACFDIAFHITMQRVEKLSSIPRKYFERDIQPCGFHGLYYTYLMQEIKRIVGNESANGKLILAHLGNDASFAAVQDCKYIDSSLGFTSISGLAMDAQTGDLDLSKVEYFEWFCYQAKKNIGAYTAALEGVDILVFSGGIGEHSPEIRSQICDGLAFLGIELCEIKNMNNEIIISTKLSNVAVYVIKTNEEIMIAKIVCEVLDIL